MIAPLWCGLSRSSELCQHLRVWSRQDIESHRPIPIRELNRSYGALIIGVMTIGEKLLSLTAEYQQAGNRADWGVDNAGRSKEEIGAEYEATLRELLK